jgi:hypothetical protein
MPRGGKRPGAGRPKGSKEKQTLAKEAAREVLRQILTAQMEPVAHALVSRCKGVRYFVTRNKKTGKYEIVTNPEQVAAALNAEDENAGEFYTDKPETAAIKEFFDRIVDKAKEQVDATVTANVVYRWKDEE